MSQQTVGSLIDLVRRKIIDEDGDQLTDAELIQLYNLALFRIVTLVTSAYTRTKIIQLLAGAKQTLPEGDFSVVNVLRNMGTDGQTPGRVIRATNMDVLEQIYPEWFTETPQAEVEDWAPVIDYPEQFYVVPPNDGTGYVELQASTTPPLTAWDAAGVWENDTFPLRDNFTEAAINGILYMAYDDDSDIPGNTPRSQLYYQRFMASLGLQPADQNAQG